VKINTYEELEKSIYGIVIGRLAIHPGLLGHVFFELISTSEQFSKFAICSKFST
jgi:hypothetical protein